MQTHRITVLSLFFALATTVFAQDSVPDANAPPLPLDPETSIPVNEDLTEGFKSMERLETLLKGLGDPTKKQPTESNNDYLNRVDLTIKARALYLHHLHQEIEKVLMIKYRMEDAHKAYENWIKHFNVAAQQQPAIYKKDIERLEKLRDELASDAVVLASLLMDQAVLEENEVVVTELQEFWGSSEELKAEVSQITDASTRSAKFESLKTVDEKREKLAEFLARDEDADIEIQLLGNVGLPEAERFSQELPKAHREVFAKLSDTLTKQKKDLKRLEQTATKVSVLARFCKYNLLNVRPRAIVEEGKLSPEDQAALATTQDALEKAFIGFNSTTGEGAITSTVATDRGKRFVNRLKRQRTSTSEGENR